MIRILLFFFAGHVFLNEYFYNVYIIQSLKEFYPMKRKIVIKTQSNINYRLNESKDDCFQYQIIMKANCI